MPTRFKYVPVSQSSYGLTPVEILLADDNQLNNVVGLKQMQPYRRGAKKPSDLNVRLKQFRREFQPPTGVNGLASDSASGMEEPPKKRRKGKKERQKLQQAMQAEQGAAAE